MLLVIPGSVMAFDPVLSGERNLEQEFQFTVRNVTGLNQQLPGSDVTYKWTVYDYRIIGERYTYWSVDWGQWFSTYAEEGKEFLVIWVRSEMKGNTSWYGWGPERFRVWVWGNTTAEPMGTPLQDLPIEYGSDKYRPVVIAETEDLKDRGRSRLSTEWYGWKDGIQMDRQEPGNSGAWDGMIFFEIPKDATADDIRVLGYSWYGYSVWYLTEHKDLKQVVYKMGTDDRSVPVIYSSKAPVYHGRNSEKIESTIDKIKKKREIR